MRHHEAAGASNATKEAVKSKKFKSPHPSSSKMDRAVSYLYELSAAAGGSVASNGGQGLGQGPSPGLSVNSQLPTDHLMAPGNDNYCLRWNEFEKKYAESFRHLRDNEYFTDVTLTTEGHSVKAHRVILSACSTYFHAILKSMGPWQHPVLMLQDVKPQDLNALMDFIYFGQVHMSQDSLPTFLKIAERLKIKGLCETLSPISMPPTPTQIQGSANVVGRGMNNQGMALPPMANSPHALVTTSVSSNMAANFENLLPRSPYIPPDVNTSSCGTVGGNNVVVGGGSLNSSLQLPPPSMVRTIAPTSAPPAHQSPKQVRSASNPRPESLVYVSPVKRTKFSTTTGPLSPQSILRNQLLAKEIGHQGSGGGTANDVEVKSEPMAILSSHEDMPSSGVNVQELMSTHEGDLASLSAAMPQGISPHFMFSPDPDAGGSGAHTVVVEDRSASGGGTTVRMVEASLASSGIVTSGVVTSVNVSGSHASGILVPTSHHLHGHPHHSQSQQQQQQPHQQHQHQQQHQQQPQTQHLQQHDHIQQHLVHHTPHHHQQPQQQQISVQQQHHVVQAEMHKEEPQDLTPSQHVDSPGTVGTPSSVGVPHTPTNHGGHMSSHSPSTPTPPKNTNGGTTPGSGSSGGGGGSAGGSDKKTGARKSCPYCNKDFHEMSLKRHIKDVHFRSQNTCVTCPQCCKQYASQNSLYSHLNRVHNVKKDVMSDLQLPMGSASNNGSVASGNGSGGSSASAVANQHNDSNHHDGIVNLTHHSEDSSNG